MVYAELMHNPYLLKTKVCFNGQEPKINSHDVMYRGWITPKNITS